MANQYTGRDAVTYNGWSNFSTWNIQLWLDNEYALYREYSDLATRAANNDSVEQAWDWAKALYRRVWRDYAKADGCIWKNINWEELRANFDDAVKEVKEYR